MFTSGLFNYLNFHIRFHIKILIFDASWEGTRENYFSVIDRSIVDEIDKNRIGQCYGFSFWGISRNLTEISNCDKDLFCGSWYYLQKRSLSKHGYLHWVQRYWYKSGTENYPIIDASDIFDFPLIHKFNFKLGSDEKWFWDYFVNVQSPNGCFFNPINYQ